MSYPSAPAFQIPRIESFVRKVGLYCRVSTKEQTLGYSMDDQEESGLAFIDADPTMQLFKIYRDPGVSGTRVNRPGLDELREDIRNGFLDVILVKAIDRIGRSERVLMPWFWMLEEAGVDFISMTQNIDTTTSQGKFALSIFIAQAQAEWNAIRERTQGGLNAKAKAGGWVCGEPPFGYMLVGKGERGGSRVVPNPKEVEVIEKASELLLVKGYSMERAATALNATGYRTRSGVPWTAANLRMRLNGPLLDGYTVFRNVKVTKGTPVKVNRDGQPLLGPTQKIPLPPALPEKTIEGLRAFFAARTKPRGNREHLYTLSGRLTGTCGGYYVGRHVTATKTHMYFCFEHSKGVRKGCRYYRADLLEKAVWKSVVGVLGNRKLLERAADDWIGMLPVSGDDYRTRIAELDRQIAEKERLRTKKLMEYAMAGVDADVVKAAQDQFKKEEQELKSQRAIAQTLLSELETALERKKQILALADLSQERLLTLAPHLQAQIYDMLDLKVEVVRDTKNVRLAHPCKIEAFFRETGKPVPDTLTDEQWETLVAKVPALSPKNRKISLRAVLEAGFYKVRNDIRWKELPEGFPNEMSARAIWLRWIKEGVLPQIIEALGEYPGTPVEDRELPELRVTGVLEGTLATLVAQDEDNNLVRNSGTASSETVQLSRTTSLSGPRPVFTVSAGRVAA